MTDSRRAVSKTYKMLLGGAFVRSEGGHVMRQEDAAGELVANVPRATRKDLRDSVGAAAKAAPGWAKRSAFNRGQILFRIAEMLEGRRGAFVELLERSGFEKSAATREVDAAVDRAFWYAGWTDKLTQVLGSENAVATPFQNTTTAEPIGTVVVLAPTSSPLLGLLSAILPPLAAANACVAVSRGPAPSVALELGEVIATSDVPAGVVNLLTAEPDTLAPESASHMNVGALAAFGVSDDERKTIATAAASNLKRVAFFDDPGADGFQSEECQSPYWMERFVEWKTSWYPVGV